MSGQSPTLSPETLKTLREIASPEHPDFFKKLFTLFLKNSGTQVQAIRNAVEANDWEKISATAHALKSSGANIGALTLAEICRELEMAARNPKQEQISDISERLLSEVRRVEDEIRKLPEMISP